MAEGNQREVDLAWAAGLIDGEGSIGLYPQAQGRSFRAILQMQITEKHPLLELHGLFGGSIFRQKKHGISNHDLWHWALTGKQIEPALRAMMPYFRVKGLQAGVLLQFLCMRRNRNGRRYTDTEEVEVCRLSQKLKALKKAGDGSRRSRSASCPPSGAAPRPKNKRKVNHAR